MNESNHSSRAPAIAFVALLALLLLLYTKMILPYVIAIVMGQILALIANKPYQFFLSKNVRPNWAGGLTIFALALLIVVPLSAFTVLATKQAVAFGSLVASADHSAVFDFIQSVVERFPISSFVEDSEDLVPILKEQATNLGNHLSGLVFEFAKSAPQGILQLFLACMTSFYLLVDRQAATNWMAGKLPFDSQLRKQIGTSFSTTAIAIVWASMIAAATQAALITLAFLLFGVPSAFLAGGATFIFAWIPLVGSVPVLASGLAYLIFKGAYVQAILLSAVGILTGIADNIVRPIVLGGRGEMHPMVSIVSIFGGIQMFGVFGVFIGPILAAVLITLLQIWPIIGRQAGFKFSE